MGIFAQTKFISESTLKDTLLSERHIQSKRQIERNLAKSAFTRNTDDWVRVWIDEDHKVLDKTSNSTARRAITDDGLLIWMVLREGRRFAYHATAQTAQGAFAQAAEATARRQAIRVHWADVRKLRRKILMGRYRSRPKVEDARAAGLCELGVQGFLRRTGLGQRETYPGYFLALASFFDPQIAFPLWVEYQRRAENIETPRAARAA